MLVGHFDKCQGAVSDSSRDMVEISRDEYAVFCELWPLRVVIQSLSWSRSRRTLFFLPQFTWKVACNRADLDLYYAAILRVARSH